MQLGRLLARREAAVERRVRHRAAPAFGAGGGGSMAAFLADIRLGERAADFVAAGYDDVAHLLTFEPVRLRELALAVRRPRVSVTIPLASARVTLALTIPLPIVCVGRSA